MTGHPHDSRRARDVERGDVAEGHQVGRLRRAQAAATRRIDEEPTERSDPDRAPSGHLLGHLAARACGVGLVDVDRDARLPAEAFGHAGVVGVTVGQHDRPDVVERAAHPAQLVDELLPLAREAGVDDRDLACVVDEVDVDDVGADLVDRWGELHDGVLVEVLASAAAVGYDRHGYDT